MLYKLDGTALTPCVSGGGNIKKVAEANLQLLLDAKQIASGLEFTGGGAVDTVAVDSEGRVLLIEYEGKDVANALFRLNFYSEKIPEHEEKLEKLARDKAGKKVSWDLGVRLVLFVEMGAAGEEMLAKSGSGVEVKRYMFLDKGYLLVD
jgi:hypothetical protein